MSANFTVNVAADGSPQFFFLATRPSQLVVEVDAGSDSPVTVGVTAFQDANGKTTKPGKQRRLVLHNTTAAGVRVASLNEKGGFTVAATAGKTVILNVWVL